MTIVLVATGSLSATACGGGGGTTKAEFVDHAVEFSTAATTDADKDYVRKLFSCVWDDVKGDADLVDEFMSAEGSDEALSASLSAKMAPCVTAQAGVTIPDDTTPADSGAVTTVPAG